MSLTIAPNTAMTPTCQVANSKAVLAVGHHELYPIMLASVILDMTEEEIQCSLAEGGLLNPPLSSGEEDGAVAAGLGKARQYVLDRSVPSTHSSTTLIGAIIGSFFGGALVGYLVSYLRSKK